jgi:hypothetical protein
MCDRELDFWVECVANLATFDLEVMEVIACDNLYIWQAPL